MDTQQIDLSKFNPTDIEKLQDTYQKIIEFKELLDSQYGPLLKKLYEYGQNQELQDNLLAIYQSGNSKFLLMFQVLVIILWAVLRAWQNQRAKSFLQRLWVSTWTTLTYIPVASIVVPVLVYGRPYWDVLKYTYKFVNQ